MDGADPRYEVTVAGGRGAVVGDYATVFQIYGSSDPALSSHIRVAEFAALLDERLRDFVGRTAVLAAIERAVGGGGAPSGYICVRGEPGIGKTSIAARVVQRLGCVHHFNIATQNIRSAQAFLHNVSAQLIVRYELEHASLPPGAGESSGFLSRLLHEAAERSSEPVVVVVDALDEAEDVGLPAAANRLFLPATLPAGVFFVLTMREDRDYRLNVDHETEIWIREDDPDNERDLMQYAERFIDGHGPAMDARLGEWGVDRDAFIRQVVERSEGNFMYLVHVLRDVASGRLGHRTIADVEHLPRGLRRYYERHWRSMRDADRTRFEDEQRPVLCFLAVSREPVTARQLAAWAGLKRSRVKDVLNEWREFLNEERGEEGRAYRLYHRSFADFLDDEEDLRWHHKHIVDAALARIPGL